MSVEPVAYSRATYRAKETPSSPPGRDAILSRIREALRDRGATQLPQPTPISSTMDRAELVRQFAVKANRVEATAHVASTVTEGHAVLRRWLTELQISGFLYVPSPVLERLGVERIASSLPSPLEPAGADEARSLLQSSPAGVSEATAALTNT